MELAPLRIGDLTARIPIVQGAMGIGVSLARLASAVANEGGVGMLAGVQMGFDEPDFETHPKQANDRALRKQIRKARQLSPEGILGINIMTAVNHYQETVRAAVEEGIDLIVSGAGLPSELPGLTAGSSTKVAPIVSSGKAAATIAKIWDRKHQKAPDLVIVEGPEAGGHLGFSQQELAQDPPIQLDDLLQDVIKALRGVEEKYQKKIPVVAAGGIFDGKDIARLIKKGADGVQMATRFVTTEECDADPRYKEAYLKASPEDVDIVQSPVGMPGRAIINAFVEKTRQGRMPIPRCYQCLKPCDPASTPYCISDALVEAVRGHTDQGLVFAGSNAGRLTEMTNVRDLMTRLVEETKAVLNEENRDG